MGIFHRLFGQQFLLFRSLAAVAGQEFLGFKPGIKFVPEPFFIGQADHHAALPFQTERLAALIVVTIKVGIKRRDHLEHQVGLYTAIKRMAVTEAAKRVVLFVDGVAILAPTPHHLFKDQFGQQASHFGIFNLSVFDLLLDFFLFVGEEHIFVTVAGDQQLIFQTLQAGFDPFSEGNFIGINLFD